MPIHIVSDPSVAGRSGQVGQIWRRSWFWAVVLPFLLYGLYLGLVASDRYVAEAMVIVKQADGSSKAEVGLSLLSGRLPAGGQDVQLVRQYILSLDMLHLLDQSLALRKHYESKNADLFSRLGENQTQEDFLEYYRNHIMVDLDDTSGVLTIEAQAFTPGFAQDIVKSMIKYSEQYINQINHTLATEQVNFVKGELDRAADHLRASKKVILEFQEKYKLFDPQQESGAKLNIVNELEAELTRDRAQLSNLSSYMNESAAEILALKSRILAVERQLQIERSKLVGDTSTTFSDINAKHADLLLDLEFATDFYKGALVGLEQARVEAYQKLKYLVVVDSPSLAEEPEYPRKVYNLASLLVILFLVYGASKIIWATIKEHRDV